MKTLLTVLLFFLVFTSSGEAAGTCQYGRVQGFLSIRNDPVFLVGTIPNELTSSSKFVSRRYNCKGRRPLIKRVDLGVYDVRFPGLSRRTAIVTAISQEGVAASVQSFGDTYRVSLRGPISTRDVLVRRDIAFSIALF